VFLNPIIKAATISVPMPTPVGHAVGGLAAAWLTQSALRSLGSGVSTSSETRLALMCGLVAMLPDIDILVGSHRTLSHSVGAALMAGLAAWIVLRGRTPFASRAAVTIAAAYGSHVLLDWLGKDSSTPPGLMALWPFSSAFCISGVDLFAEVSRRYWNPDEFILENLRTLVRELVILGPIAAGAWVLQRFNR
jgi:hypothetical protein